MSYSEWKFNRLVQHEVDELLKVVHRSRVSVLTAESTKRVPLIVQKWLRRSNVIGKEISNTVHLKQTGRMRTKPDGEWMNFEAEQYFTTPTPGFIWKASIDAGYFLRIAGRDKYNAGHGNMLIKAMNIVPIANSHGSEVDQGTALRYLSEMVWFPSAALSAYVTWESVGEMSARATMHNGDKTVSGIFTFNSEGDVVGFEAQRYGDFGGKYSLELWSIKVTGYKEFDEIRIANECEVTWKLSTGNFTWLKVDVTDIDYNITNEAFSVAR